MKIGFMQDVKYSEDGLTVKQGHKGETRDVAHTAACSLLNKGVAYNAEPETGNLKVDEVFDNIRSVVRHIDKWHEELHAQMDELNKLLRPVNNDALKPLPNKELRGVYMPGMQAVLQSGEAA